MLMPAPRQRSRWLLCWWLAVLAIAAVLVGASPALAQDTGEGATATDMFTHIISSAGFFFGPLLLLVSIALVALIVLLALDLRMGAQVPPWFVDEFTDTVNKRQF